MPRIAVEAKRQDGPEPGPRPPGGTGEAGLSLQGKAVPTREDAKPESPRTTDRGRVSRRATAKPRGSRGKEAHGKTLA